jgi:hypothetical protein
LTFGRVIGHVGPTAQGATTAGREERHPAPIIVTLNDHSGETPGQISGATTASSSGENTFITMITLDPA